ncbi:MAG: chemotaxis response regulator protein-glutamate methylesterase [Spirochaetota bacterium]
MAEKKTRVLIIDDSALVRDILSKGLSSDPEIEVVGTAPDVYIARDKIVLNKPNVLTLDVEMPRMDGVEFLKRLMPQYPLPVIMVSAMTAPGAKTTLEALENGAIDFVLKPSSSFGSGLTEMIGDLREKVKAAAGVDVSKWKREDFSHGAKNKIQPRVLVGSTDKVIAIGASTGGTTAIRQVVSNFPADMPGTVIVQHMPPKFTNMFAEKLNEIANVEVKEAESGDRIVTGRVLIAPGGYHMEVYRSGGNYLVKCFEGEKVNGHCPSVEVLFRSMAKHVGSNAVGVILTGMGRDGADAMLEMRKAGARTFAQDEKTSVIFGMPGEAYKCGGVESLIPLGDITTTIINTLREMK